MPSLPPDAPKDESRTLWSRAAGSAGEEYTSFALRVPALLLIVLLGMLLALGVAVIYSATIDASGNKFFHDQVVWVVAGGIACLAGWLIPIRFFYRHAIWLVILVALPLAYLALASVAGHFNHNLIGKFPMISEIKGAVRWLRVGGHMVQPSEFAKLALAVFLSAYYGHARREDIATFTRGVLLPGAVSLAVMGLILTGKDLSTTVITGGMVFAIMFLAGVKSRYLLTILLLGLVAGYALIYSKPYRVKRMTAFRNPDAYRDNESYQLYRSLLCLGSGGLTGRGYAKGYMKSYLPESHTDFIVSVIGEEFGLLGVAAVILLYLALCTCIVLISSRCRRRSDLLFCLAFAVLVALQAMVNICVVSGAFPPTGVTAPFLSYGGSSLLSLMFMCGMVLHISHRNRRDIYNEMLAMRFAPVQNLPDEATPQTT